MHSSAEFRVEGKRLIVEVSGAFDPDESVQRFERIMAACRSGQLAQVLVDCRELASEGLATVEIIYVSRIAAVYRSYLEGGGRPFRIAYVASDALELGWHPGAEVAKGEDLALYTTKDFDAAIAWLDA